MSVVREKDDRRELSRYLVKIDEIAGGQGGLENDQKTPLQRLRRWLNVSFVVRSGTSSGSHFSLMGLTQGNGQDDSEAIIAFIKSRALLDVIDRDGYIHGVFAQQAADRFSAFPSIFSGHSQEDFYKHFNRFVDAEFVRATGITKIEVQAFSAKDAHEIALRILTASEGLVNRLNARARSGLVKSAEHDVQKASDHLKFTLARVNELRNERRVLEPELEATAAVKLSSGTEEQLAALNVQLAQAMIAAPQSPLIAQLRNRRAAIERELSRQDANQIGGPGALSNRMQDVEEANAERGIAEKRLLAATAGLVTAQRSADRQQLYVERIAEPNVADEPRYPRILFNLFFAVLICGALTWIALSLAELVAGDE